MTHEYIIYSDAENTRSGEGAGFWSNTDGWTTKECASRFSQAEREQLSLPSVVTEQDARWIMVRQSDI